jgi:hypothetical protein
VPRAWVCFGRLTDYGLRDWTLFRGELWKQDELVVKLTPSAEKHVTRCREEWAVVVMRSLVVADLRFCGRKV